MTLIQVREMQGIQKALSTLEAQLKGDWILIRRDFKRR